MIDSLIDFLDRWQTLLTGLLALIAAWWTVKEIRRQIELQKHQLKIDEKRHAEVRERRSLIGRAQLPDALSRLGDYTAHCLQYASGELTQAPSRPDEAVSTIKAAIEFVDAEAAEQLLELTKFYQIHNSRLSHFRAGNHGIELTERQYDSIRLRWLADRLYGYARGNDDHQAHRTERDQMISALHACVGFNAYLDNEPKWARLLQHIEQRHPDA